MTIQNLILTYTLSSYSFTTNSTMIGTSIVTQNLNFIEIDKLLKKKGNNISRYWRDIIHIKTFYIEEDFNYVPEQIKHEFFIEKKKFIYR